ncbi:MAG TPA: acetate--CoA ligase family protein [Stellaceae bacterium]|nr:acetate--CoA ligase family protein [Stellaceae bacterium]
MAAPRLDPSSLAPLFRPQSVAVIGASSDPTKLGSIPLAHMKASGFKGPLYPINPRAPSIQDLPAFPSVRAVPGPVDLAVIAVPEQHVLPALRDCAEKGVRAVVLFTSGFAEVSEAGRRAQEEIKALTRGAGMRLLGPNCMGLVNFTNRLVATFHLAFGPGLAPAGRIGLITQSGAFGGVAYQVAQDRGLAYSLILTTGNEGDVDVADGVAYLAEDPGTAVIMIYLEGSSDGAKLAAALALARQRRKPVVCLKVGRTEAGVAAIASHTAALAGTDEIFDAMFRQHGVHRAVTMEEFFDIGYAAAQARALPKDERLGVITVSGGVGVLMADAAAAHGLDVPPASPGLQAGIRAMVPFAATRNPIDVTGQIVSDMGILDRALEMAAADGAYPSLACFLGSIGRSPVNGPRFMEVFARLGQRYPDTLFSLATFHTPEFRAAVTAAGCLIFDEPTYAVRAVAALAKFRRAFDTAPASPPAVSPAERLPTGPLDEVAALAVLERAGIPSVAHRLVRSAAEAADAAAALGLPAALKIVSPDITHKTDIGGVALNLATADAVRRAFDEVTARVKKAQPAARITGCLVAPMAPNGGVETILGAQWDPVFGPVVMLGLGGIFVEAMKDVTFRLAPFDEAEAHRMIGELRAASVLRGLRGRPPADLAALAKALAGLSRFAAAQGPALRSLDINPFLVLPESQGALALDAVVIPGS